MAFLSIKDNAEVMQSIVPMQKPPAEAEFYETYAAGVGVVIDEELSISALLNNEAFGQRKEQVRELGKSGQFNLNEYTSDWGEVDYNRIAADFPEFNVKNDRQLYEERAEMLKKRREYANDVFERGSGMAQFLGNATAFMLDPINIATMPIATMGAASKSLTTIGRALTVARNEAGLAIAAELMIQPLVYQHKHDINSPFEFEDALFNVVTAATGAAALGGVAGGISGYFKKVRETAETQPLDNDAVAAMDILARVEDDLNMNPEKIALDLDQIEADFLAEVKADLLAESSTKLTRKERKDLNQALTDLNRRLEQVTEAPPEVVQRKGIPARKAKADAKAEQKRIADDERANISAQINEVKARINADKVGSDAFADVSRIEQGIVPERYKKRLEQIKHDAQIDVDRTFLQEMNNKREVVNPPSKVPENYEVPKKEPETMGTMGSRERDVLSRQGIQSDYDNDIAAFNALENPKIIMDDEMVDAGDFMQEIDNAITGMDDILRCAIV